MVLFDSHCHLTDERFAADVEAVLVRAREAGVVGVVSIASDAQDAVAAAALAARHPDVWCTAGIHPHAAATGSERTRAAVEELAAGDRVVAVGETGLDYHYDNAPRDVQRRLFDWHLDLAARTGLGVVVHSRDAEEDTAAAVRNAGARVTGVLHCFTAGAALLDTALDAGWYVSFAGLITFRNWTGTALLQQVPADRLLIETDSPYLAPVPERGRRNEPAFVRHTCTAAAGVLGVDPAELALRTTRNARRFYGLDGQS
jgi:TatD DNase family protein